ncbi:MAG: hypothetical protein SF182_16895 [Deltaproteobacteria bacterium]|nr:hypothetical protein [Deltaproteobacteria bacterium]
MAVVVGEAECAALGVRVQVAVRVTDALRVGVCVAVPGRPIGAVAVRVGEGLRVGVWLAAWVTVRVGLLVRVTVEVRVALAARVGL